MWAPVEDWEVVKRSPDNLEKVLQVMSSHLLDKTVSTAAGTVAWIFLTALKAKMDCALHDAVQGRELHRQEEGLEPWIHHNFNRWYKQWKNNLIFYSCFHSLLILSCYF